MRGMSDDALAAIGERARQRVLAHHTAAHRAHELTAYARETMNKTVRGK